MPVSYFFIAFLSLLTLVSVAILETPYLMVPKGDVYNVVSERKLEQDFEFSNTYGVYFVDGVEYFPGARGFYAEPVYTEPVNGVHYPGVIMIHENRGLRPEIKDQAMKLAAEGYKVLAVDLFGGIVMETQEEARAYREKFNQDLAMDNLLMAYDFVNQRKVNKTGVIGWCFGGRQSLELAMTGIALDATVVYYGSGMATSTRDLMSIESPVLGVFGDQDQLIPLPMVEDFRSSLDTLEIENEIYVYEGVGHAFANPSNPNFAPEETAASWDKTLTFLNKHLR